jgi:DNA polymerase-3 subunit epsilon
MPSIIAFDVETTGQDDTDRIVSLAATSLDEELNPTGKLDLLFNPGIPIPAEATEIHGITDEMVADKPSFAKSAARLQRMFEGAIVIGHNVSFDWKMLHGELVRAGQKGLSPNPAAVDTLSIERIVNGNRLEALYQRYVGKPMENWHEARADVDAVIMVLKAQLAKHRERFPRLEDASTFRLMPELDPKMRVRLDHGGKFHARLDDGIVRFGFGKHKDEVVTRNHTDYLAWITREGSDFPADARHMAHKCLGTLSRDTVVRIDVAALLPNWGQPILDHRKVQGDSEQVGEAQA